MIFDRLIKLFTSLKLTVVLLTLGIVLIFWGTIAQVHLGLFKAQNEFFRSFFVFWQPAGSNVRIPIFPGGYLIGGLLLINLFAAHFRYYKSGGKKIGIVLIHLGIVLLLLGQFLTDFLAQESSMHIRNGETTNYSESDRHYELAVVDTTDLKMDKVVAFPSEMLKPGSEIGQTQLPFKLHVKTYFDNSSLADKESFGTNGPPPVYQQVNTTAGIGGNLWWVQLPRVTKMNEKDIPAGIVEVLTSQGSLGTILVSGFLSRPQEITLGGHRYQIELRPERFYKPFWLHLIEFRHDKYPGTDIPKNFSSRVRLMRPATGEDREVLIYMNNPLRYWGETYYQASFDPDDQGTVLQVVHNPGWLTPYFACILVSAGLVVQFLTHLIGFAMKRKTA